jgi:hypothetical protein
VPFRPALVEVRFRRPTPGTRAAYGGDGEIRAEHAAVYGTAALPVGANRLLDCGRGVRPTMPLRTPRSQTVTVLPG